MKRLIMKTISLVLLLAFSANTVCYGLATLPASQNPIIKREILSVLQRTQIRYAESEDAIRLLNANNAECLLLSSGKYLVTKEVAQDDIRLLRAIIHEDIEAIMQVIAKEDRYQGIKGLILKYFPPDKSNNLPVDLYVNHTVARAFEWLILVKQEIILRDEIPQDAKDFIEAIEPIIKDNRHNYFTEEFWDSIIRGERIRQALNKGMVFYQVANSADRHIDRKKEIREGIDTGEVEEANRRLLKRGTIGIGHSTDSSEYKNQVTSWIGQTFGNNISVLSVGAGRGDLEIALQSMGMSVTALECYEPFVEEMKAKGIRNVIRGDARTVMANEHIIGQGNRFDLVIFSECIGTIGIDTIETASRLLKNNGAILVIDYKYTGEEDAKKLRDWLPTNRINPELIIEKLKANVSTSVVVDDKTFAGYHGLVVFYARKEPSREENPVYDTKSFPAGEEYIYSANKLVKVASKVPTDYEQYNQEHAPEVNKNGITMVAGLPVSESMLKVKDIISGVVSGIIGDSNFIPYDAKHTHATISAVLRGRNKEIDSLTGKEGPINTEKILDIIKDAKSFAVKFTSIKISGHGGITLRGVATEEAAKNLLSLRNMLTEANFESRNSDQTAELHVSLGHIKNLDKLSSQDKKMLAQNIENALKKLPDLGTLEVNRVSLVYYQHHSLSRITNKISLEFGKNYPELRGKKMEQALLAPEEFERLLAVTSASEITGVSFSEKEQAVIDALASEIEGWLIGWNGAKSNMHIVDLLDSLCDKIGEFDDILGLEITPEAEKAIKELISQLKSKDGKFDYHNLAYQAVVSVVRGWPKREWHAHVGDSIHEGFVWNEMVRFNRQIFAEFEKVIENSDLNDNGKKSKADILRKYLDEGIMWHHLPQDIKGMIIELFTKYNLERKIGIYDLASWKRMISHVALEHFADGVTDLRLLINVNRKFEPDIKKVITAIMEGFSKAEKLAEQKYGHKFSVKLVVSYARQDEKNAPENVEKEIDEIIKLRKENKDFEDRIVGIDISGAEAIIDPSLNTHFRKTSDYRRVFEKAQASGMIAMSHLGDWGHTYKATEKMASRPGSIDLRRELAEIEDREERVKQHLCFIEDGIRESGPLSAVMHGTVLAPQGSIITKGPKKGYSSTGEAITDPLNLDKIEELLRYLREKEIEINTCPTVNSNTQNMSIYRGHPLHQWIRRGNKVAISTDDLYWNEMRTTLSDDITKMMLAAPQGSEFPILTPALAMEISRAPFMSGTKSFSPVKAQRKFKSIQLFLGYGSTLNKVVLTVPDKFDDKAFMNLLLDIANAIYTFGASTVSIYSPGDKLRTRIKEAFSISDGATYDDLVKDEQLKKDPCRAFKITSAYLKELYGEFGIKFIDADEKRSLEDKLIKVAETPVFSSQSINIKEIVRDLAQNDEYYLGLDIGASGIKVSVQTAMPEFKNNKYKINPEGIYSRRFVWSAPTFTSSNDHHKFILETIKQVLTDMGLTEGQVKGIGVSIPTSIWGEHIASSTFTKGIKNSQERQNLLIDLGNKIEKDYGFRPVFSNDGGMAAFYVSVVENKKDVLCVSLGSGLGAGYVGKDGRLTDFLTEMGALSIIREGETRDHEQVGITGAATQYVTQKGVFYLAAHGNYLNDREKKVFNAITEDAQKSFFLRILMENASPDDQDMVRAKITDQEAMAIYEEILIGLNDKAVLANTKRRVENIFNVIGEDFAKVIIRAYPLLKMRSVIVFGGVASKGRGDIIIAKAKEVLGREFPQILKNVNISLSEDSEFAQSMGTAYYAYQQSKLCPRNDESSSKLYDSEFATVLLTDLIHAQLQEERNYEIKYDTSRLTPFQIEIIEEYARLLQLRSSTPNSIKLRPFSSAQGSKESLIAVYCAGKDFKGEGHVDVAIPEGELKEYLLRITGMVNIALASSNIPDNLSIENVDKYRPIMSYIKNQYKAILGEELAIPDSPKDILKVIRKIVLGMPKSMRMKLDQIEEYNRLAKQALTAA